MCGHAFSPRIGSERGSFDCRRALQRKNDFFHIILLFGDLSAACTETFTENIECGQAAEHDDGVSAARIFFSAPAGLENHGEDKRIHGKHQQRQNETPEDSEKRSAVFGVNVAPDQLLKQIPVFPDDPDTQCRIE